MNDRPTTNDALTLRTDRQLIRSLHHSTRYVVAEVVAPPAPPTTGDRRRPRANVAFVLDRSGSMGGDKVTLVKAAVREAIGRLERDDRFALVVYDQEIDVLMPTTLATADARRDAIERLERIDARGTTDLGGGWLRGAEQVAGAQGPEGINRVLLLTDGLANVGITDPAELIRHARELRARGIGTSTFGVGDDFDEALLGSMADAGGGAFRYIRDAAQIPGYINDEVGEVLEVTARDVALEIAAPDALRVESLSPFPVDARPGRTLVRLGDMGADQEIRFVLRLGFPLGEPDREIGASFTLTDRDGALPRDVSTLTWRFADNATNDHQPRTVEVDRLVARTFADRVLRDVVGMNRSGDFEEARRAILATARRIASYAGRDSVLRGIVAELEREAERWSQVRLEVDRKVAFASMAYSLKSRSAEGVLLKRTR
jgi:Ca-activated chloride channel family protein